MGKWTRIKRGRRLQIDVVKPQTTMTKQVPNTRKWLQTTTTAYVPIFRVFLEDEKTEMTKNQCQYEHQKVF